VAGPMVRLENVVCLTVLPDVTRPSPTVVVAKVAALAAGVR
jgi:hypothetical protein